MVWVLKRVKGVVNNKVVEKVNCEVKINKELVKKFKEVLESLQKMQSSHKLSITTRYINLWLKDLNYAIAETQRLIINNKDYKKQGKSFLQFFVMI